MSKSRHNLRPQRLIWTGCAVLLFGLLLSSGAALWVSRHNAEVAAGRFAELTLYAEKQITQRLFIYEHGLRGARGAVLSAGHERIDRRGFNQYMGARDLAREFPGARGMGFIRRVPVAEEAHFLERARVDGKRDFSIRQLTPHDGDRYVIQYIEPISHNEPAIGLDIASETDRRWAAEQSMRSGLATLTAPISLVQLPQGGQRSFLFLLPIYSPDLATTTPEQRVEATVGWSYAPLQIDEVLADFDFGRHFSLTLRDVGEAGDQPFFSTPDSNTINTPELTQTRVIALYGRTWEATLHATERFIQDLNFVSPSIVFSFGSGVSLLLALLAYSLGQTWQRNAQVRAEQTRLAAIVESSNDAIIGESLDGIITDWNRAAELLFGRNADEVLGKSVATVLLPPERAAEDAELRAVMSGGVPVPPFDTTRLHADGRLLEVSVSASPIVGQSGRCSGFSKTLRDIGPAKRAEQAVRELNASLEKQVIERTAALEAARQSLRTTLDAVPFAVSYIDRDLVIRFANSATQQWAGGREVVGHPLHGLIGERFEDLRPRIDAALRGQSQAFELTIPMPGSDKQRHTMRQYLPDVRDGEVRGFHFVAYDMTEQVEDKARLAAALRDREALLRTLHEHAIVSVTDPTDCLLEVNDNFCKIAGYTREELLGNSHNIVSSKHHDPAFWRDVWRTIGRGKPWRGEICNRAKDGSLYWVDSMIAPFADERGKIVKYVSIRFDITARKRMEAELTRTNERIALAADGAGIGIWEFDLASRTLVWDDWMFRLHGMPSVREALAYEFWAQRVHPDDLANTQQEFELALSGERAFNTEFRIIQPEGSVRVLRASAHVVRDATGKPLRVTGVNFDITERKRVEQDLIATSSLLSTVLDSASEVSIIAADQNLNITVFNAGAERLLGYTSAELVGKTTPMLLHDLPEVEARAAELTKLSGETVVGWQAFIHPLALRTPHEWTYIRKDGTRVQVSLVVTAMYGADGKLFGFLGIAHDVTRQKEIEASLREAIDRAERANLTKSQFLASMSHEIRTPLNAIIGLTYLVRQTRLDAEQSKFLTKIETAGRSLLSVINDTLDFSKIEAGELTIERAPFELQNVIDDVAEVAAALAQGKNITHRLEVASGLPPLLIGDSTRTRQVLINLVANAIKFTERGSVELRVLLVEIDRTDVVVRFEVEDTGIGISKEALSRLFTPFVQADASTTRRFGGSGLGLSIVKRLTELMGGEVGVTSELDQGSTFWVQLRFRQGGARAATPLVAAPAAVTEASLSGKRVLVVDDSDVNLEVARRILERKKAFVICASNGHDAVELLRRSPQAFDIVLMDLHMPIMDGHAALDKIKNDLGLTDLPVVALTADARTSERERCLKLGMADFLSKPFDAHALIKLVLHHTGSRRSHTLGEQGTSAAACEWPELAGIDGKDSCERLGGDVGLFRSLLTRLLQEYSEFKHAKNVPQDNLGQLAMRAHKLRGSAGQLGARQVQGVAERLERACRDNARSRVALLLPELATALCQLQENADRAFSAEAPASEPAESAPTTLTLEALLELLREQNLKLLAELPYVAGQLARWIGPEPSAVVCDHIQNLRFADAAKLVEAKLAS